MDDLEEWMPIQGFPNYLISSYGQVLNRDKNRLMRIRYHSSGKRRVALYYRGRTREAFIHRLVAEHFMGNYSDGLYLEFRDGNVDNCHISNIEAIGGRRPHRYSPRVRGGNRVEVLETGQVFLNAQSAAEFFKTDASTIYKVLRGERKRHLGMRFQYYREG